MVKTPLLGRRKPAAEFSPAACLLSLQIVLYENETIKTLLYLKKSRNITATATNVTISVYFVTTH